MNKILKIALISLAIIIALILVVVFFLYIFPGVGKIPNKKMREEYSKRTEYYYNGEFHNINNSYPMTGQYHKNRNSIVRPKNKIKVNKITILPKNEENLTITWLGHSTSIIQLRDKNILIDPVLTNITSPIDFIGPSRFSEIALLPENVPDIDVLLLSHDHYDHLDYPTIKKIDKKVKKYIVPLGVESYLLSWGINPNKIITLAWWEDIKIDNISFTATPSNHFSGRNPLERNTTWWCGYFIKNEENSVYYTGDTGYSSSFKEVYKKLGEVDVLMADSGQYNEAWKSVHMNPIEDLQVAQDTHAKYYIPIHWGAFVLSDHNWYDPGEMAVSNAEKNNVNVITPRIAEHVKYSEIENYKEHWWNDYK